jgi:sugar/nucleoside kinase (ribokinase family)
MTAQYPNRKARRFDVTLAGDTNLDLLMYGLPEKLPLERELLANGMAIRLGGSGAITAHNLAALGNSVGLISPAADDEFGRLCRAELSRAGVDLSRSVPVRIDQTGVTVHLQHARERHMLTYGGATFRLAFENLDLDYLADTRHFHMSSYYLQSALTPRIPELFEKLKQAGLTISLDPNDDPSQQWDRGILEALHNVDVLMPNAREACLLAGESDLDQAIRFLQRTGTVACDQARSRRRFGILRRHRPGMHPLRPGTVVDAIGAGDSFNAGFIHAWIRGWPMERALAYANLAGAWSTTASGGTSAFRESQVARCLRNRMGARSAAQSQSRMRARTALSGRGDCDDRPPSSVIRSLARSKRVSQNSARK